LSFNIFVFSEISLVYELCSAIVSLLLCLLNLTFCGHKWEEFCVEVTMETFMGEPLR